MGKARATIRQRRLWASLGSLLVAVGGVNGSNHTSNRTTPITTTTATSGSASFVVCRITLDATLYQTTTASTSNDTSSRRPSYTSVETTSCIPVIDQVEEPHTFSIDLPDWIREDYVAEIQQASLHVAVASATVDVNRGVILLSPSSSSFTILPDSYRSRSRTNNPRGRGRRLVDYTHAFGTKRYAMVRISTPDSEPSFSAAYLRNLMTASAMATQFHACSLGQMEWTLSGVYDISLPHELAFYDHNPARLRDAVVTVLQAGNGEYAIRKFPHDVADHVLFCMPPGTGTWIANAATGHWRSQYNDRWCLSLSAQMHELGHNLGQNHAGEAGNAYGDWTSYMGSVVRSEDAPKKCWNAAQHHTLGWYADGTLPLSPLTDDGVRVQVAAFVDANKAEDDKPVVLNLDETYYGQYNRAAAFNVGTEEYKDEFVLIDASETGRTNLVAHLSVGESYDILNYLNTGRSIRIKVCESLKNVVFSADYLVIGIGRHSDPCSYDMYSTSTTTLLPSPAPSQYPTRSPVRSPSVAPVESLSSTPTMVPTILPSSVPVAHPSSIPSEETMSVPTLLPINLLITRSPTMIPGVWLSSAPNGVSTPEPSTVSSERPSVASSPSSNPTREEPTDKERQLPSEAPSTQPASFPTVRPSYNPTRSASPVLIRPSESPLSADSLWPSDGPSFSPTEFPTVAPTQSRTDRVTMMPSEKPLRPSSETSSIAPSLHPTDGSSFPPTKEVTTDTPSSTPPIPPTVTPFSSPPPSASPTRTLTIAPTPDQKESVVRNWQLDVLRRTND